MSEPEKVPKLSVAVATFNEESTIRTCFDSVKNLADEIVVVDGGSTDNTVEAAHRFTRKVLVTDNPPIFHINKQKAIDACSGKWVLQLDADEVVSADLASEIKAVVASDTPHSGFYIRRKNFFLGKWIRKGGWYPDPVIRLFKRGKGYLPCKSVHEQMHIDGSVGALRHDLLHYSYRNMKEYWRKAESYIAQRVRDLREQYKGMHLWSLWLSPLGKFVSLYLRHQLILEGYHGLLLAWASALQEYKAVRRYLEYANSH